MAVKTKRTGDTWTVYVKSESGKYVAIAEADEDQAAVVEAFFNPGGHGCRALQEAEAGNPVARDNVLRLMLEFLGVGQPPQPEGHWTKWAPLAMEGTSGVLRAPISVRRGELASVKLPLAPQDRRFSKYVPKLGVPTWEGRKPDGPVVTGDERFVLLIRGQGDPERAGRGQASQTTVWKEKVRAPVKEWKKGILAALRDGKAKTFHRIAVEVANVEGATAGGTNAEAAMWELTKEGKIEHTNEGPVYWRLVGSKGQPPAKLMGAVVYLPVGRILYGVLDRVPQADYCLQLIHKTYLPLVEDWVQCKPSSTGLLEAALLSLNYTLHAPSDFAFVENE